MNSDPARRHIRGRAWRQERRLARGVPDAAGRREGIVVLTNSDRMDGILGLTEQAWGDFWAPGRR